MDMATKWIKTEFIVHEIAKAENIETSQEELDAYIEKEAVSMGYPFEEYKKVLEERNTMSAVKATIIKNKVFRWLIENADMGSAGNIFTRIFKRS
jgi:trigger factor